MEQVKQWNIIIQLLKKILVFVKNYSWFLENEVLYYKGIVYRITILRIKR